MQGKGTGKTNSNNKKANDFDSAFEKFAKQLPKDYVEQFKKPEFKGPTKDAKVRQQLRTGKAEIVQKSSGNKNTPAVNIPKLLEDDKIIEIKETPKAIASQVATARAEKKLSQQQLATKVSENVSVIISLEKAEGAYNPKVIEKIEKALGIKIDRSSLRKGTE